MTKRNSTLLDGFSREADLLTPGASDLIPQMRKKPLSTAILAVALVVFFALPSFAAADQVVPPGNSAATQYTQAFPTSGGNVVSGTSIGQPNGGGGHKSPSKVIGKQTTEELESQGSEGKAVAELAAEGAPETSEPEPEPEPEEPAESSGGGASGGGSGGSSGGGHHAAKHPASGPNQGAKAGGGKATQPSGTTTNAADTAAAEAAGNGSSGLSEVVGTATGANSGQMGVFLPIVLLGALVLALVFAWRRRHDQRAAS
jgi:MYXO-CTERM domain-containing protein